MTPIKHILVGVDGSENALRAVHFASLLAKGLKADVTLVHVIAPSDHAMISGKATFMDKDSKVGGDRLIAAEQYLTKEGVRFSSTVEFGHPAEQILSLAKDHDMVVVGSRGLSSFKEALMGSTSHRLAQLGKVPVTIVP